MCFFQGQTLLDDSQEWLVWLMWNEKEVHRLDAGWTMWPWPLTSPMTLTFDFSRSNFKNSYIRGIVIWMMWNKKEANQLDTGLTVWSCPLTTPITWPCSLKIKVWNSLIWGMGVGHWLTWKERAVSRSFMTMTVTYVSPWWDGRMYHIVTGVTSDVGMLSTYLV